jgi:hypothetical protein
MDNFAIIGQKLLNNHYLKNLYIFNKGVDFIIAQYMFDIYNLHEYEFDNITE